MYYGSKLFGVIDNSFLATFGNGRLYNWYAVSDPKGLAPTGWKVPTQAEFTTLAIFLGGASVAGGPLKSTRTGLTPGINSPNTGATNASGFNGLGSGYRLETGEFTRLNQFGLYWSATEFNSTSAIQFYHVHDNTNVIVTNLSKKRGKSIRCILDNPANWSPGMMVTDIDGNSYTTVKTGTQAWMGSNLKTTRLNDGTAIPNITDNSAWGALTTPGQCTYNNAAIAEYTELITL